MFNILNMGLKKYLKRVISQMYGMEGDGWCVGNMGVWDKSGFLRFEVAV